MTPTTKVPPPDLHSLMESGKLTREQAQQALEYFNNVIPSDLTVDEIFLLSEEQIEDIFWATVQRAHINLFLGNFSEAFTDEMKYWTILNHNGEVQEPLEEWSFALYQLALGDTEQGLANLKKMASLSGDPLTYLLLRALGQSLPEYTPSPSITFDSTFDAPENICYKEVTRLFKEQRFEEAIKACDAYMDSLLPLDSLVRISSEMDPGVPVQEIDVTMGVGSEILALRGLSKAMLGDLGGALQDYEQLLTYFTDKNALYRWGDLIVKLQIHDPALGERTLELGYLYYLNGDLDKAKASFDSLVPTFGASGVLENYRLHNYFVYCMRAAASRQILMLGE